MTDAESFVGGLVREFLWLISGENIADHGIGIMARLAYTLVEPANVSYSSKGFLIQRSGVRQGFEFCAVNLATYNQDKLYERSRGHLAWAKSPV